MLCPGSYLNLIRPRIYQLFFHTKVAVSSDWYLFRTFVANFPSQRDTNVTFYIMQMICTDDVEDGHSFAPNFEVRVGRGVIWVGGFGKNLYDHSGIHCKRYKPYKPRLSSTNVCIDRMHCQAVSPEHRLPVIWNENWQCSCDGNAPADRAGLRTWRVAWRLRR